jgi:CheY-like chemotaxis protein
MEERRLSATPSQARRLQYCGMERPPKRVLVVDDNADARNSIRMLLEMEGFSVCVAANGREAIEIQRRAPADVVLTDIFMPEKDGIETIQELRASNPSVQIAVMSGSQKARLETLKVVARELGVSRFLLKPVEPAVLIDTVKELARLSDEQGDA